MSTIKAIRLLEDMLHPEQWGYAIPADLAKAARPVLDAMQYDHRRIYLCGPMSGPHGYNIKAFSDAAKALRARGYSVFSPNENGLDIKAHWLAHVRVNIAALMSCGRMGLLKEWEACIDTALEHRIASTLGMEVRPLAHYLGTATP